MTAPAAPQAPPQAAFTQTGIGRKIANQPDHRAVGRWVDQHGRRYHSTNEKATGHPAGPVHPWRWTAPQSPSWAKGRLVPDQKYVRPAVGPDAHSGLLVIDYAQWLLDWDVADRDRAAAIQMLVANEKEVTAAQLEKWVNDPPKFIIKAVGPGPGKKVPRELIEACIEGNQWALGLSDVMPRWAEPIVKRWAAYQTVTPKYIDQTRSAEARYPDAEFETATVADEGNDEENDEGNDDPYGDIEEAVDPDAIGAKTARKFTPPKKKSHKKQPAKQPSKKSPEPVGVTAE